MKFGGSSVADKKSIEQSVSIVAKGRPVAVVISAMGSAKKGEPKVTDQLIQMGGMAAEGNEGYRSMLQQLVDRHRQTIQEVLSLPEQENLSSWFERETQELTGLLQSLTFTSELTVAMLDRLMTFGERLSASIFAAALRSRGIAAEYVDAREIIWTNDKFGEAEVDAAETNRHVKERFQGREGKVQVVPGFSGSTSGREGGKRRATTLGRNGSDTTATTLGAALKETGLVDDVVVQIWKDTDGRTDVNGVMTADPRKVEDAEALEELTPREAAELTEYGMGALHSKAMGPARRARVPVNVRNTANPEHPGTLIHEEANGDKRIVKGISSMTDVAQFNLTGGGMRDKKGFAARVFNAIANAGISMSFIVQVSSEQSISFTVPERHAKQAESALKEELHHELGTGEIDSISYEPRAMIAVVGEKMKGQKGTLAKVTNTLRAHNINIVSIGQSPDEFNITIIVDKNDEIMSLRALHEAFLHADRKVLHLVVVGPGQVAGKFLEFVEQRENKEKQKVLLRVVGIANKKRAALKRLGIPLDKWRQELEQGKEMSPQQAFDEVKKFKVPNTVLIDLTSGEGSKEAVALQIDALQNSHGVVTASKEGQGSELEQFDMLMNAAEQSGAPLKDETTVGAGLPVMITLDMLHSSGDRVRKVMASLSGTLGYLFANYDGSVRFSDLVKVAKAKGYTEKNPKEDLNMNDVRRKALILGRKIGFRMEVEDVEIEHFLSNEALSAQTPEEFFAALEAIDDAEIEARYQKAKQQGKVLRCLASIENGKAKLSLAEVKPTHPLYSLAGTDNKISFVTNRYPEETPLTIQGPGAGVEVTAAGILSDVLQIANSKHTT